MLILFFCTLRLNLAVKCWLRKGDKKEDYGTKAKTWEILRNLEEINVPLRLPWGGPR